jgi:hypothetical protein
MIQNFCISLVNSESEYICKMNYIIYIPSPTTPSISYLFITYHRSWHRYKHMSECLASVEIYNERLLWISWNTAWKFMKYIYRYIHDNRKVSGVYHIYRKAYSTNLCKTMISMAQINNSYSQVMWLAGKSQFNTVDILLDI